MSYGPCQFPTLGFIVDRYKKIKEFVPEKFWSIQLKYRPQAKKGLEAPGEFKFEWLRERVFDKLTCLVLYERCLDSGKAKVIDVIKTKRYRQRPHPLNTIEAQKLISRKLRISSAQSMEIMEKLYQRGILSYPRTETNCFNPTINLRNIVSALEQGEGFGDFAQRVASGEMWGGPKNGKLDDKAHPPIHPVKGARKEEMDSNEWKIYDLISRHFLATISKDAIGNETKVDVQLGSEIFIAKGLIIEEQNWLEVFPFEKWSDTVLPQIAKGEEFVPNLSMTDGETKPPQLLTEADLISKMDQNGIGTDATIHEHIKTVQERHYAVKQYQSFVPTPVGVSLVEAYEHLGIELYKPYLRAQMENDMKLIAQGAKSKEVVLRDCINEMNRIFKRVYDNVNVMRNHLVTSMKNNGIVSEISPSGGPGGPDGGGGAVKATGEEKKT